jgi:hypothetical protein
LTSHVHKASAILWRKGSKPSFARPNNKVWVPVNVLHNVALWTPDDKLLVFIDNKVEAVISSPILCKAIFDMYLGPDSIFRKYRNMAFTFHKDSTTPEALATSAIQAG